MSTSSEQTKTPRDGMVDEVYWKSAFDCLPDDEKAILCSIGTRRTRILSAVAKVAENHRQLCLRRQWKFPTMDGGSDIILRDVMEKIITWVERFRSIDTDHGAASIHATLPWTAVLFLLEANRGGVQIFGPLVFELETVIGIIYLCRRWEQAQERSAKVDDESPCSALVDLRSAILSWLSKTISAFQWSPNGHGALELLSDIHHPDATIRLRSEIRKNMNGLLAEMPSTDYIPHEIIRFESDTGTTRFSDWSSIDYISLDDTTKRGIQDWISDTSTMSHHDFVNRHAITGSGHWAFLHDEYRQWLNSSFSDTLLIHGSTGCGKSTLFSMIMESLGCGSGEIPSRPGVLTAFFYCHNSLEMPQSSQPVAIFLSIIRQLIFHPQENTINQAILFKYEKWQQLAGEGNGLSPLDLQDCVEVILSLTANHPAYIGVDGLNEVSEESRISILQAFQKIKKDSKSLVKILLTGRERTDVNHEYLTRNIQICSKLNKKDVEVYFQEIMKLVYLEKRLLGGQGSAGLTEAISAALLAGTAESFLWVKLQTEIITRKPTEEEIFETLNNGLTEGLEPTYRQIFDLMNAQSPGHQRIFRHTFCWVLYAGAPITSTLLCHILGLITTDSSRNQIQDICYNLVNVDEKTDVLGFYHGSVKDYALQLGWFSERKGHEVLATYCLEQLTCSTFISGNSITTAAYAYAAEFWPDHMRHAHEDKEQELITLQCINHFMFINEDVSEKKIVSQPFLAWVDWVLNGSDNLHRFHNIKPYLQVEQNHENLPYLVASAFGLDSLLQRLLSILKPTDLGMRLEIDIPCLSLASAKGYDNVVSTLLACGANAFMDHDNESNPMKAACSQGHANVVNILLHHDVLSRSSLHLEKAIEAAFFGKREDIVMMLLEHETEGLNALIYLSVLRKAIKYGYCKLTSWLLSPELLGSLSGAETRVSDACQQETVEAIQNGHIAILRLLLSLGVLKKQEIPKHAIGIAATYGKLDMAVFLYEMGIDPCEEGSHGSPLTRACFMGHERIVQQLLLWETNSESISKAIFAAASQGHVNILQLLIKNGATVGLQGDSPHIPLHTAAFNGQKQAVLFLLSEDSDIYTRAKFGDSFEASMLGGQESITKLFLELGYEMTPGFFIPGIARSERQIAFPAHQTRQGHRKVGYQSSASPQNTFSVKYSGALVYSASCGSKPMIEVLLKSFFLPDEDMHEAMIAAASNGHHDTVQTLLSNGLKHVHRPTVTLVECLKGAAMNGYLNIVELLLQELLERDALEVESLVSHVHWDVNNSQRRGIRPIDSGVVQCLLALAPYNPWPSVLTALEELLSSTFSKGHREILSHAIELMSSRHMGIMHEPAWIPLSAAYGQVTDLQYFMDLETDSSDEAQNPWDISPRALLLIHAIKTGNIQTGVHLIPLLGQHCIAEYENKSAFLLACAQGLKPIALQLAERRQDLELDQQHLSYGVYWAISFGHCELVKELITHHAALDFLTDCSLGNALAVAIRKGFEGLVTHMLQIPSVGNRKSFQDIVNKCLALCCSVGNKTLMEVCLEKGAQVNDAVTICRPTATDEINYNQALDHFDVWEAMEPFPQTLESEMPSRLLPIRAVRYANSLQAMLEGYQYIRHRELTASHLEVIAELQHEERKRDDVFMRLLEQGCDPSCYLGGSYKWPLHYAAFYSNEHVVQALLDAGAGIFDETKSNALTPSPIECACDMFSPFSYRVVLTLLKAGFPIPTTEEGHITTGILRVLEYSLKGFKLQAKGVLASSSHNPFTLDSCQKFMSCGMGELILAIFRMLPKQRADAPIFAELLHLAAIAGDFASTNILVKHGANVNFSSEPLGSCLDVAARNGHIEVITCLLDAGADIGSSISHAIVGGHMLSMKLLLGCEGSSVGNFHLLAASMQDNEKIMDYLLETAGNDPKYQTGKNGVLGIACAVGKLGLATKMLRNCAEINQRCLLISLKEEGNITRFLYSPQDPDLVHQSITSPLYTASDQGHTDVVNMLIREGADVNLDTVTELRFPLVAASSKGHLDIVKILLEAGAHLEWVELLEVDTNSEEIEHYNENGGNQERAVTNALWEACSNGFRKVVEQLLSHPGCASLIPDALLAMCQCESLETVQGLETIELLLEALNGEDDAQEILIGAFEFAVRSGNYTTIELLLEYMTNIDSDILVMASLAGSLSGIRMITSLDVSVCAPSKEGHLPLHSALYRVNIEAARFLLESGADVNQIDGKGRTPLESLLAGAVVLLADHNDKVHMLRRLNGIPDMVKALLDHGYKSLSSGSELRQAAYIGCVTTIRLLVAHGVPIDASGDPFATPLFAALEGNQPQVVEYLIQQGADPNLSRELEEGDARLSFDPVPVRNIRTQSPLEAALGNPSPELLDRFMKCAGDSLEISDKELDNIVRASIWQQQPCRFISEFAPFDLQIVLANRPSIIFHDDVVCNLIQDLGELLGYKLKVLRMVLDRTRNGITQKMLDCATDQHMFNMLIEYEARDDLVYDAHEFRNRLSLERESEQRGFLRPGYGWCFPTNTDSFKHATFT